MKIHWAVLACATLAACQRPQPAPTEQKPEPQATALRDHIQQPLDKARGVQAATDQAAAKQRATIDAATQ
ncbi:hypothetical protein [Xanthomonas campestris]|uniref:hypothetical protein n=1 Tax=Xanthomonas campestris TaxID=339 RepID=UPI000E0FE366|nr:hypothetical protein [Xanthomonas campestris]